MDASPNGKTSSLHIGSGRGRAVVVASPPAARWWPAGGPDRRKEAATRAGRGVQWCWWRLVWRADLAPDRAAWVPTQRAPVTVHRSPSVGGAWCHASVGARRVAHGRCARAVPDVSRTTCAHREPIRTHRTPSLPQWRPTLRRTMPPTGRGSLRAAWARASGRGLTNQSKPCPCKDRGT